MIDWLEKNWLGWSHESVGSQGGRFVNTLTDVLWYIDGHQEALRARTCHIPAEFEIFVGFNNPEKSKHRKKEYTNLQNRVLKSYSNQLADITLQPWMSSTKWKSVREAVVSLSESIGKYSNYLAHQSMENHSLGHPVREGKNSECIPGCAWIKPTFAARDKSLEYCLTSSEHFQPLLVNDYAPAEAR